MATDPISSFTGKITVSNRIVDALSSGLYESPAACLKELINNSYDADATEVRVFVKPDADRIVIADDGRGMTKLEFTRHFDRVSESYKRDGGDVSANGRPMIGKIGIGFIAANEICEVMEIYSTTAGNSELLHVAIDFTELTKPTEEREQKSGDVAKADYRGEILEVAAELHFTEVYLTRVKGESREVLAGASRRGQTGGQSLYGRTANQIAETLCDAPPRDWRDFDRYSETMLRIGLNVPVKYHDDWAPPDIQEEVEPFASAVKRLGFAVYYDQTELLKPIIFCPGPTTRHIVSAFEYSGTNVSASGYFYVEHGSLQPQNLNGLLIRIRNAAVGEYDRSFLGFPTSVGTVFQRWISAEIWASDELEAAMNIDRKTLRTTHPAYVELQTAVHAHLESVIERSRSELYASGSKERRAARARKVAAAIAQIARKLRRASPEVAEVVEAAWADVRMDQSAERAILRTYSVDQVYEIIAEASSGLIDADEQAALLTAVSQRLRR